MQNLPWDEAREICKTQEATGDLVSITSEPIQKFLESLKNSKDPQYFWIGASKKSGSFEWSDGSQWSYVPADSVQVVDRASDGQYGVLVLMEGMGGMWSFANPNITDLTNGCICQYPV